MKTALVLDASAFLAYLKEEQGYEPMFDLLEAAKAGRFDLFINELNVGEIYYILAGGSPDYANMFINEILHQLPVSVEKNDLEDIVSAAGIKVRLHMPYVDSFVVATARKKKAEIVTTDPDFKKAEKEIKIRWLR